ncbi:MAG TPA: ABC transporter ATP-binding protein [Verrucomicrobiae bacterium]|jgi:NitT/TauT family transport system ATP-binding protein|nr:ABC transporter ATP-binding protein [Verrucomicrobiae bacterium]
MAEPKLIVRNLRKTFQVDEGFGRFSSINAIDNVNIDVREGELITIIGPSGCGKSTLLMILAGLYDKTSGEVLLDGRPIEGPGLDRGVVFQEFALFPWLTVRNNICFGLKMKGVPAAEHERIIKRYLDMVKLAEFEHIFPHRLSGGMKQRVGIARALAYSPEILLMDEPFGALDAQTRTSLQQMLVDIWAETKKTILFVTHSVREAVFLSDRIVVLSRRPSRVRTILDVKIPRPRVRLSEPFLRCEEELEELIARELSEESSAGAAA